MLNCAHRIYRLKTAVLAALLSAWASWAVAEPVRPAVGHDNPTLAYNLHAVTDYDSGFQFLDQMKMTRPWVAHTQDTFAALSWEDLQNGGFLDAQGWVRAIPEGMFAVGTLWHWGKIPGDPARRTGVFILDYEGTGQLSFKGDAKVISSKPGQIVFEKTSGGNFFLNIEQTDPNKTGDYIRNITIVRQAQYELFQAGGVFDPDWVRLIADARQLRFMNWLDSMTPSITRWDQAPLTTSARTQHAQVALADMVQLANEVGADPWFTIAHTVDDAYIRAFATYVRDHLDPALKVRIEYSNETWNWGFKVSHWLEEQAKADWGQKGAKADYYVKRATETLHIWDEVFGQAADTRLVKVLAGQAVNTYLTGVLLKAKTWRRNDRANWVDPTEFFDEFAITHYFGGKETTQPELRSILLEQISISDKAATRYIMQSMQDPAHPSSIPGVSELWAEQARLVSRAGLKLTAYEGGQHLHHLFGTKLTKEEEEVLTGFYEGFSETQEMAKLYRQSWEAWKAVSDGPFMQLTEVGKPSRWGSFGLRRHLDDDLPRARMLDRLNAKETPWWDGAVAGAHYQHGVTERGGAHADKMVGTPQEDYLIGLAGNDTFRGGPGNDGLHGGPGTDRAVFSGTRDAYVITQDGAAYVITGPDGRDRLVEIEEIAFDDTGLFTLP